jgi:hypothetical protein
MDLDDMLSRADNELAAAEAELEAAQQRVAELRTIQQGVRLALQRYGRGSTVVHVPAAEQTTPGDDATAKATSRTPQGIRQAGSHPKSEVNQSDLCIETLQEFARPASSAEVRERLRQRGHEYDPEQIRATFAYLLRKERVVRVSPGVWALPSAHLAAGQNGASAGGAQDRIY